MITLQKLKDMLTCFLFGYIILLVIVVLIYTGLISGSYNVDYLSNNIMINASRSPGTPFTASAGVEQRTFSKNYEAFSQVNYTYVRFEPKTKAEFDYYQQRETKLNDFHFRTLINAENVCSENPTFIIGVKSRPNHAADRQNIRHTWGSVVKEGAWPHHEPLKVNISLVFIFGQTNESDVRRRILAEHHRYKDIIQGEFDDSYYRLTEKSLFAMDWVVKYCHMATYFLSCDEDMFLNVPYIVEVVANWERNSEFRRAIMGPHMGRPVVGRGRGKWALKYDNFPFKIYPPYEAGTAYVITMDVLEDLINAAEYLPYIHIDDVFITGIAGAVVGLKHAQQPGFGQLSRGPVPLCQVAKGNVLTRHGMVGDKLRSLWHDLEAARYKC